MNNRITWADQAVVLLLVSKRTDEDVDAEREVEQAETELIGDLRGFGGDGGAQRHVDGLYGQRQLWIRYHRGAAFAYQVHIPCDTRNNVDGKCEKPKEH